MKQGIGVRRPTPSPHPTHPETCDQIWQQTFLGMILCHEGLEKVSGGGVGERRQATRTSQTLSEAVERQVMHTNGHRQACQTHQTNYLLQEPAAQYQ